jgi:hypothetical protein
LKCLKQHKQHKTAQTARTPKWHLSTNFYTELIENPQYNVVERLKLILTKSMSAFY